MYAFLYIDWLFEYLLTAIVFMHTTDMTPNENHFNEKWVLNKVKWKNKK